MVAWQDGLTGTTKDDYTTPSVAVNLWDTIFVMPVAAELR